jgi:nucleotide-binding universal stress UspA family protein
VVVGVDGRGGEEELLSVAADEARSRGAGLVIVRAVRPGGTEDRLARPQVWDETWMAVHQAEQTADVSSRVVVAVDEPVRALLVECGSDDLLVVGTRGEGRLAGLVGGSVARGVIDAGLCDVVVVPPGAHVERRPQEVGLNAGA